MKKPIDSVCTTCGLNNAEYFLYDSKGNYVDSYCSECEHTRVRLNYTSTERLSTEIFNRIYYHLGYYRGAIQMSSPYLEMKEDVTRVIHAVTAFSDDIWKPRLQKLLCGSVDRIHNFSMLGVELRTERDDEEKVYLTLTTSNADPLITMFGSHTGGLTAYRVIGRAEDIEHLLVYAANILSNPNTIKGYLIAEKTVVTSK